MRLVVLTTLTLVAFAANSVLCRAALGAGGIDAASFATIRFASGALVLGAIVAARRRRDDAPAVGGTWASAAILFLYAVPFSFAYVSLPASVGALILFGSVQATMLIAALAGGERPRPLQWIGLATALGGLVWLVLPGLDAPAPVGAALMATAGVAWGLYSLRGRGARNPIAETAGNFVRVVPLVAAASVVSFGAAHATAAGVGLAVASGALASGGGYAIWYAALPGLTATTAAIVQLAVPVFAAAGGVLFMAESITARLVTASVLILGGVGASLVRPTRSAG